MHCGRVISSTANHVIIVDVNLPANSLIQFYFPVCGEIFWIHDCSTSGANFFLSFFIFNPVSVQKRHRLIYCGDVYRGTHCYLKCTITNVSLCLEKKKIKILAVFAWMFRLMNIIVRKYLVITFSGISQFFS